MARRSWRLLAIAGCRGRRAQAWRPSHHIGGRFLVPAQPIDSARPAGETMAGETMAGETMAGETMAGETMTGETMKENGAPCPRP